MSQTLTEQIISHNLGREVHAGDTLDRLPLTKVFLNDVIGPPAILYALEDFRPQTEKHGIGNLVFDKKRVVLVLDHTIPSCSEKVSEGINIMKEYARDAGIQMYKQGEGIEHILLPEQGFIVPGDIVVGTDSHTDTNGALNCLSFGVGTTDAKCAMVTGYLYNFTVPESILFELNGKPPKGVSGKDIILYIIGEMGAGGCSQRVAEFYGPGLMYLSMDDRFSIANMCVEMSARTGIFSYDQLIRQYVAKTKTQWISNPAYVKNEANYAKKIPVNLEQIEPMVAFPHSPANSTPISAIDAMIEKTKAFTTKSLPYVKDTQINYAFIGSCTNGRKSDLKAGAEVLKRQQVHADVTLIVIPGSRDVYKWALNEGILEIYAEAGALIESPNCGPCFGKHMGVLGPGDRMISTSNRNYLSRMGSKDAFIFLASPATVAASAIEGKIADPRKYLKKS